MSSSTITQSKQAYSTPSQEQQYRTTAHTAIVTRPSIEKLRYSNNSPSNQTYDIFSSPFHTPSLFSSSSMTPPPYKSDNNDNDYINKYCCTSRDDLSFFQSTPHDSLFNIMADIECSSSSSENTRAPSPKTDTYGDIVSSTVTATDIPGADYSLPASISAAAPSATTGIAPPPLYYPNRSKYNQTVFVNYSDPNARSSQLITEDGDSLCDMESVSTLRYQLKEADETIKGLLKRSNFLSTELENSYHATMSLQTTLTHREKEIKEKDQKLNVLNQLYEAQANRIYDLMAELSLYQSFVKSNGLEMPMSATGLFNGSISTATISTGAATAAASSEASDMFYSSERNAIFETATKYTGTSDHSVLSRAIQHPTMSDRKSPINYRRSFDKHVDVDWTAMVNRITKDTDQQASIFMQQKLKSGSTEQKPFIFQAILEQAYALMTNRFGNFLVQRQFELGTPKQVALLADTMRGRILQLTCEPFGCHVVQKALDYVDESTKVDLVSELLVCIPETITHKYACHVWQKVFEIHWSPTLSCPPPVMSRLHEALHGQWARIALDETGSLVIQNIFENKTEKDKRPILNEVLDNIANIAKGQWGNWVVQHILEQAERDEDRERAFEVVVEEAVQLSTDQFASKVVEKALRIGGNQFLARFIKRITSTTATANSTSFTATLTAPNHRMALMDIASDQYGNYVAQWLINNASEEHKVHICRLIKRHMVSLRGAKYGQRVAFLVEKVLRNYEITTYPKN